MWLAHAYISYLVPPPTCPQQPRPQQTCPQQTRPQLTRSQLNLSSASIVTKASQKGSVRKPRWMWGRNSCNLSQGWGGGEKLTLRLYLYTVATIAPCITPVYSFGVRWGENVGHWRLLYPCTFTFSPPPSLLVSLSITLSSTCLNATHGHHKPHMTHA